jgi:hypothetical protein
MFLPDTAFRTKRDFIGLVPESGRTALVLCLAGFLAVIGLAAAYRPSIDYAKRDPQADAIQAFANGDTRYLTADAKGLSITLPPGQTVPEQAPLKPDRDIRLLPAASGRTLKAQTQYLSGYNATMAMFMRRARSSQRPLPIPRPVFALFVVAICLPAMVSLYLRYRLGVYTRSGEAWTAYFASPIRPYLTGTYTEEGQPLLRALWAVLIVFVPWVLLLIFLVGEAPLR